MTPSPPRADGVTLRRAEEHDQAAIRQMVLDAGLDPTALHWSHFVIAEHDDVMIGVGQVRPAGRELGSLVVLKEFRDRGIGAALIDELIRLHPGTLYLECRAVMAPYYRRFGFEEIRPLQAPFPLSLKASMGRVMGRIFGIRLAVMRREATSSAD